jgi:hypothetical protein
MIFFEIDSFETYQAFLSTNSFFSDLTGNGLEKTTIGGATYYAFTVDSEIKVLNSACDAYGLQEKIIEFFTKEETALLNDLMSA